ncbi:MAG: hypothetical protein M3P18_19605 [Actinomycetota bacterium]|nr:hypothetical protein [Actinomycetota bacterium]
MLRKRKALGALAVFGLLASIVAIPIQANAATKTLNIRVGGDFSVGKNKPVEDMRFFPSQITVHQGDKLRFRGGFHTATVLPVGTDPQLWIDKHDFRLGDRYFIGKRDEEGHHKVIFNPNLGFFGPQSPCGLTPGGCSYDGTTVVDSGLLFSYIDFSQNPPVDKGFKVKINANVGATFWVICRLHPDMRMKVTVRPDSAPTTTQTHIRKSRKQTLATDKELASSLWAQLQKQSSHVTHSGKRVIDAYAGYDTRYLALFGMFPKILHIKKGQAVRWHFNQLVHEPHSVVFPAKTAQKISTGPPPFCETANGDVPANFGPTGPTCPNGKSPELEFDKRLYEKQGDGKVTSRHDHENSGARGPDLQPPQLPFGASGSVYKLHFPKVSPRKGYKYACGVHGLEMVGRVKVR